MSLVFLFLRLVIVFSEQAFYPAAILPGVGVGSLCSPPPLWSYLH